MSLSLQAMTAARHQWPVSPSVPEVRPVPAASEPSTPVDLELLRKALDDYVSRAIQTLLSCGKPEIPGWPQVALLS
jgi:hypothetical protein